jgi:hypothetical protein
MVCDSVLPSPHEPLHLPFSLSLLYSAAFLTTLPTPTARALGLPTHPLPHPRSKPFGLKSRARRRRSLHDRGWRDFRGVLGVLYGAEIDGWR